MTSPVAAPLSLLKRILLLSAFAFALFLRAVLFHPFQDFAEYWAAGHLFVGGSDPYSLKLIASIQQSLGWIHDDMLVMVISPPWILPLIAPLGFLQSYTLGCWLWSCVILAALMVSSSLLLKVYSPDRTVPKVSDTSILRSLFIFSFAGVLVCLRLSQASAFLLLGLAGFLYFEGRRPLMAGFFLFLLSIKPNLVYLVLLAIALDAISSRKWKSVAVAAGIVVLFSAVTTASDHHVFSQWRALMANPYTTGQTSGIGGLLRFPFGEKGTAWIQYLPMIAGLAWFASWRTEGAWPQKMPMLVIVSLLTAPYVHVYDQALLAIPIVALFAGYAKTHGAVPFKAVMIYTVLNLVVIGERAVSEGMVLIAPIVLWIAMTRRTAATFQAEHKTVA